MSISTATLGDRAAEAATSASVSADDTSGSTFHPLTPTRFLDTRNGTGAPTGVAPRSTLTVTVPKTLVPSSATAVVMNVTVTQSGGPGHLAVFPGHTPIPATSTINFQAGQTVANLVTVQLGRGETEAFNSSSASTVQLIADLAGYYDLSATGERFRSAGPRRVLDTDSPANGTTTLAVRPSNVPADAGAVVLDVSVEQPEHGGHLIVFPGGPKTLAPNVSNLNFPAGRIVTNLVTVALGGNGDVGFRNVSAGTVHLVATLVGYYRTNGSGLRVHPTLPSRALDTRSSAPIPAHRAIKLTLPTSAVPGGSVAAILNVTAVTPTASGSLTVYAAGVERRPKSAHVSFVAGQTFATMVVTDLGSLGSVSLFNDSAGPVNVLVDVAGYVQRIYPTVPPVPADGRSGTGVVGVGTCPAPGSCVFTGEYSPADNVEKGMLLTLSNNVWTATSSPRPLPADADPFSTPSDAFLKTGIACTDGRCYGGSSYRGSDHADHLLIETLANGVWSTMKAPLPPDAVDGSAQAPYPDLTDVVCPGSGSCFIVGNYINTSRHAVGLIESLHDGTWTATAAPGGVSEINALGCGHSVCVATTASLRVLMLGSGSVSTMDVPAPGTGSGYALNSVSCSDDSHCEAASYFGEFFASYSGGSWTSTPAPTPNDAATNQLSLAGVSCSAALCAAGGVAYTDQGQQPLLERKSGDSWVADYGDYPGSPDIRSAGPPTCDATAVCIAGGSYGPDNDHGGPLRTNILIDVGTARGWVSTVGPLPGAGTVEGSGASAFVCDGHGHCFAPASSGGGEAPFDFIETFVG